MGKIELVGRERVKEKEREGMRLFHQREEDIRSMLKSKIGW